MSDMVTLADYESRFANIHFQRDAGVLQMRLHTDNGPFVFNERFHRDIATAFDLVSEDFDNKVIILSGTGDRFCTSFDYGSFYDLFDRVGKHEGYARTLAAGRRMIESLVNVSVPIISAVNGPVLVHSELAVFADVVLVAEDALFQDATHFPSGVVPADGMNIVWKTLLGMNRGRYFLMTGQKIDAAEALKLGVVSEVLSRDALLPRAIELARTWAVHSATVLRGTRTVLNLDWKKLVQDQLLHGLAHESIALLAADIPSDAPRYVDFFKG
jgi:enoyl-CoA hydratase/carnithine racemase